MTVLQATWPSGGPTTCIAARHTGKCLNKKSKMWSLFSPPNGKSQLALLQLAGNLYCRSFSPMWRVEGALSTRLQTADNMFMGFQAGTVESVVHRHIFRDDSSALNHANFVKSIARAPIKGGTKLF